MSRILRWDACFNVRDLGGMPTAVGRRTRWGALVRSDTLCRLREGGRADLLAHGIRTVIDLRFADELARDPVPHPFRDGAALVYMNVPINAGQTPQNEAEFYARFATANTRTDLNLLEVDVNQVGLARICTAVARAEPGGVLLHCHAGKDRTGIVVALLLGLVGVPDELIADDYALSGEHLAALTQEWLDGITQDPTERARLVQQAEPAPEAILAVLDHLRTRYGGAATYLVGGGMNERDLRALSERLID
jgi:protein-tyrosine phosphatase